VELGEKERGRPTHAEEKNARGKRGNLSCKTGGRERQVIAREIQEGKRGTGKKIKMAATSYEAEKGCGIVLHWWTPLSTKEMGR